MKTSSSHLCGASFDPNECDYWYQTCPSGPYLTSRGPVPQRGQSVTKTKKQPDKWGTPCIAMGAEARWWFTSETPDHVWLVIYGEAATIPALVKSSAIGEFTGTRKLPPMPIWATQE